jgi:hypothetical protein
MLDDVIPINFLPIKIKTLKINKNGHVSSNDIHFEYDGKVLKNQMIKEIILIMCQHISSDLICDYSYLFDENEECNQAYFQMCDVNILRTVILFIKKICEVWIFDKEIVSLFEGLESLHDINEPFLNKLKQIASLTDNEYNKLENIV